MTISLFTSLRFRSDGSRISEWLSRILTILPSGLTRITSRMVLLSNFFASGNCAHLRNRTRTIHLRTPAVRQPRVPRHIAHFLRFFGQYFTSFQRRPPPREGTRHPSARARAGSPNRGWWGSIACPRTHIGFAASTPRAGVSPQAVS